jgi:small subunit ribosomal protein S21
LQVLVRDNNVDQALRVLKKKLQREGVFREAKAHAHYEKPPERRAREHAEAIRRHRKLARKKLQREGVLPAPKKAARPARPGVVARQYDDYAMMGNLASAGTAGRILSPSW